MDLSISHDSIGVNKIKNEEVKGSLPHYSGLSPGDNEANDS